MPRTIAGPTLLEQAKAKPLSKRNIRKYTEQHFELLTAYLAREITPSQMAEVIGVKANNMQMLLGRLVREAWEAGYIGRLK